MVGQEPEEYRPRRAWVEDPDDKAEKATSSAPEGDPTAAKTPESAPPEASTDASATTDAGGSERASSGTAGGRGKKVKRPKKGNRPGDDARTSDAAKPATTKLESPQTTKAETTKSSQAKSSQAKNTQAKNTGPKIDDSLFRPGSSKETGADAATDDATDDIAETRLSPRVTVAGASAAATSSDSSSTKDAQNPGDETHIRPATQKSTARSNAHQRRDATSPLGSDSEDATTVLPRTSRARAQADEDPDADHPASADKDSSKGAHLGPRSRLALLVGAVAAVVVLGLAIGYAVISLSDNGKVAGPGGGPATPDGTSASSAAPPEDSTVALNDASMLTSKDAKLIDAKRTWKVAQTQKGRGDDSPETACTTNDPVEGQPQAQQTFLRTLTASGSKAPAVLHQAESFANADEATQAFTLAAKALGGCAMDRAYIDAGVSLSGLGNQSTGVVVNIKDQQNQFRTVLLSRTGRVVNTVDVARDGKAVEVDGVAKALGQVTNDQCTAAIGLCATNVKVSDGPPPIGGDQPGFLAPADIPLVDGQDGVWSGDTPGDVKDLFSGCEGLEFSSVDGATKRQARTYLLAENTDVPESFGLDQVLLTMKKDGDAKDLVKKVRDNLSSCSDRSLTASVTDAKDISGKGSKGAEISGSVTTVSQKVNSSTTAQYRVGISRAGNKVIYTFLPTTSDFDFTDQQWKDLNVRAGERATQVK